MKLPRLSVWAGVSLVLLGVILWLFPQQIGVALFKVVLVTTAGVVGYYLDRSLFPYARPDGYLRHHPDGRYHAECSAEDADFQVNEGYHLVFALAMIRRALIVAAAMLAVSLGA
ncbi:putative holin [Methylomonas sp. MS20]|uniref:putative holin n=1 Tax=unclassified Methylomonas TaxID=2608980 RepID=UPI0028A44CF7|nr:putative holin [Methylomonas sp. MV1]MDT4328508.1 putative holin [Methylomonas sp. MV1]